MGQPANVVAASVCARPLLGLSNEPLPGVLRQQIDLVEDHAEVPRGNLAHDKTLCCLSLQASAQDATDR